MDPKFGLPIREGKRSRSTRGKNLKFKRSTVTIHWQILRTLSIHMARSSRCRSCDDDALISDCNPKYTKRRKHNWTLRESLLSSIRSQHHDRCRHYMNGMPVLLPHPIESPWIRVQCLVISLVGIIHYQCMQLLVGVSTVSVVCLLQLLRHRHRHRHRHRNRPNPPPVDRRVDRIGIDPTSLVDSMLTMNERTLCLHATLGLK
jgi:hypothetical protein